MSKLYSRLAAAIFGLLITALCLSVMHLLDAQRGSARASLQASRVSSLAKEISDLKARPSIAVSPSEQVQQLSGLIEGGAKDCGIPARKIVTISAQDARRVGQTPYYRQPTRVSIEDVEMGQLVKLLSDITQGEKIRIEDCRFAAPHGKLVGRTWNADFTLSYLIYDPEQDDTGR